MDSGNDSLLTMSNMLAITAIIPPSKEQAKCVTQLNEYLHGILVGLLDSRFISSIELRELPVHV